MICTKRNSTIKVRNEDNQANDIGERQMMENWDRYSPLLTKEGCPGKYSIQLLQFLFPDRVVGCRLKLAANE